jgi:hypothetical protein
MAGGVRDLICDLRRTAEMADDLKLLPTLETRWEVREKARAAPATHSNWSAVVAAGKDKPVVNAGATAAERRRAANAVAGARYARNMHKAQWAVREIMQDVVRAVEKWFDHELYSLFGFLACMIQTRWVDVLKVQTGERMKILIAHEDAIPNGQVGSRILDELGAQLRHQGEQQFLEFYPPQLADMLKDEAAMRQLPIFLRGDAMEEFVLLDAKGQVLLEDTKPLMKEANGDNMKQPVVAGPAPLWRFPELARRALKLYFCQLSSNDVERVLSLVARGYRGGGKNVGFRCISSWIRRRDWVSARFFRLEADPAFLEVYRKARSLIRENNKGFQQVFALDINSSELRNRWRQQEKLPDYMKNGVRKFDKTNIVAGVQEFMIGRQSDSNEQILARVMNAKRRRQQMATRLKAIKRSHVPRPRAKAAGVQTGKRKRPELALPQNQQRSHRSRRDDADCGEEANLVPAAHLNGTATVGTGITVEDARNAILNRTSPFGLHDRSVEQELVGKEDGSGQLTLRTLSWIMVPLIARAILGAEASEAFFPAFPADGSGGAGFAFSQAVHTVRSLLDGRLGIGMERDDIVVNPKDKQTLYFSQRLQDAVLNAMRADFSELVESLERWILMRFEGERQAVAGGGGGDADSGDLDVFSDNGENPDLRVSAKPRQKGNSDAGHGEKGADSGGKKDDMPFKPGQEDNFDAGQSGCKDERRIKRQKMISDDGSAAGIGTWSSCDAGLQQFSGGGPAAGGAAAACSASGGCFSSHPRVKAMQDQMDTMKHWQPSVRVSVQATDKREKGNVFGMKRPDGEVHIVRVESCCTLNLAYDESDGLVKIIQICSTVLPRDRTVRTGRRQCLREQRACGPSARLYMEYYFVYPNARAQLETAYQDDTNITLLVNGAKKSCKQIGANTLRAKAQQWKGVALYHAGDIIHKSSETGSMNLGNIVGTIAWETVETLMHNGFVRSKLPIESEKMLSKKIAAFGITKAVADHMAKNPIFLSCIFGEKRPASTEKDSGDDEDGSDAEEEEEGGTRSTGSDLLAEQPTLIQAQVFSSSLRPQPRTRRKESVTAAAVSP